MTGINFPSNPSLNQTYSFGVAQWYWNGAAWVRVASPGAQGPSGPSGPPGLTGPSGPPGNPSNVAGPP